VRDLSREYMATLGSLLREAREAAGATQLALGTALSVGESAISRWESGIRYPKIAQLHQIALELSLSEEVFESIYCAWQRETAVAGGHWQLQVERPEGLIDRLHQSLDCVAELRNAGQPRSAMHLAARDSLDALRRLRQFKWSKTHPEVIRKASQLVLQEVKAALDFLPRRHIAKGGLNPQLELLRGAGKICDDTETRFVAALALEGATYVSGDIANSFLQTRELLDRSDRIPILWMPEVLRAAGINAGKARNAEAVLDVQERLDAFLLQKREELTSDELGYVLEGMARGWGAVDPGRASEVAEEARSVTNFSSVEPPRSPLRFVQLTRTQAEIELARPRQERQSMIGRQVRAALAVSRRENYDRYTEQLALLARDLS
jgi:transcriptional regulator with XRE-family HTH domain